MDCRCLPLTILPDFFARQSNLTAYHEIAGAFAPAIFLSTIRNRQLWQRIDAHEKIVVWNVTKRSTPLLRECGRLGDGQRRDRRHRQRPVRLRQRLHARPDCHVPLESVQQVNTGGRIQRKVGGIPRRPSFILLSPRTGIKLYSSSSGRATCVTNFAGSLCCGGPSR